MDRRGARLIPEASRPAIVCRRNKPPFAPRSRCRPPPLEASRDGACVGRAAGVQSAKGRTGRRVRDRRTQPLHRPRGLIIGRAAPAVVRGVALMRRIRYAVAMSLDAYVAGPNGESDWIIMDPEIDFGELFDSFDTILMGRRTFEVVRAQGGGGAMPGMKTVVVSPHAAAAGSPGHHHRRRRAGGDPGPAPRGAGQGHLAVRRRVALPQPARCPAGGHRRGRRDPRPARRRDTAAAAPGRAGQAEIGRQQGVQDGHHVAGVRRRAAAASRTGVVAIPERRRAHPELGRRLRRAGPPGPFGSRPRNTTWMR